MNEAIYIINSMISDSANWLYNHMWFVFFVVFSIWKRNDLYGHLFKEPITGGNGVTKMDELAQYVLVILLIYIVYSYENSGYSDGVFYAIAGAVAVIAGVKHIGSELIKNRKDGDS